MNINREKKHSSRSALYFESEIEFATARTVSTDIFKFQLHMLAVPFKYDEIFIHWTHKKMWRREYTRKRTIRRLILTLNLLSLLQFSLCDDHFVAAYNPHSVYPPFKLHFSVINRLHSCSEREREGAWIGSQDVVNSVFVCVNLYANESH